MSRRFAWVLPVVTLVLEVIGFAAAFAARDSTAIWLASTFAITITAFAIAGGLISSRHPENPIGWLLSIIGLMFGLVVSCSTSVRWGLRDDHMSQGVWEWVAVGANGWIVALGLIGTQLALRLPNGQLPSARWKWFSRLTMVFIVVALVGMSTTRERVEGVPGTSNPIGWAVTEPLSSVFLLVILSFPVSITALVMRYRRASGRDRAQLRWVAFSGALFVAVYVITVSSLAFVDEDSAVGTLLTSFTQVAFAAFPIGIGFAMLRHRLYDIDVVINRALVYGSMTAMLAGTYLGSVLLLQLLLDRFTQGSGLAVATSTLATAALVRPARARIQATVDRRFFRRKYDAARTLEGFAARLRGEVGLDSLTRELRAVVADTMQPAHVTLWTPTGGGAR